jgi:SNF2 family DNA or RNA helicase
MVSAAVIARQNEPLWNHQAAGFDFARGLLRDGGGGALLAMDMGTGKTRVAIELIAEFATTVLVVAPKSVVPVWEEQIARFWPANVSPHRIFIHAGGASAKAAQRIATEHKRSQGRGFIAVLNYEATIQGKLRDQLGSISWDMIVADEAHRLKAPGGVTSRGLAALAKRNRALRLALTGTPLPVSHLDAYGLMRFTEPTLFGSSFVGFRRRYTRPAVTRDERQQRDGLFIHERGALMRYVPSNMPDFEARMGGVTYRVDASDVLDLPEAVDEHRVGVLGPAGRKAYQELEDDFFTEVRTGVIATATNALVKVLRLQQISSGFVNAVDESDPVDVDGAKRALFREFLDDLPRDEPVVVFARFHHDLDAIAAVVKDVYGDGQYGELSGRCNDLAVWQGGDRIVLGVQVQSGGVGISLTRARVAVWYSLPWSLAQYDQARARLVRPGQERAVTFMHLIMRDTIDEQMHSALKQRKEVLDALIARIQEASNTQVGNRRRND